MAVAVATGYFGMFRYQLIPIAIVALPSLYNRLPQHSHTSKEHGANGNMQVPYMYRGNRTAKPHVAGGATRKPFHIPGLHREPSRNAGRAESMQLLHRLLFYEMIWLNTFIIMMSG